MSNKCYTNLFSIVLTTFSFRFCNRSQGCASRSLSGEGKPGVARLGIKGPSGRVRWSHLEKGLRGASTPTAMSQFVNKAELFHMAQNVEAVICDYSSLSDLSEVRDKPPKSYGITLSFNSLFYRLF
jgi:hypothetical protein